MIKQLSDFEVTLETFKEIKPGLLKESSLALGFFDGLHPGHQAVVRRAIEESIRLGVKPAVVTFKEHPRELTLGKSPPLLTLPEQRLELLAGHGVEAVLMLSFTEDLCRLSPKEYVQQVLVECMGARALSVGFNHTFGRNRAGNPALLTELGKELGFSVSVASAVFVDGKEVSSSRIRQELTSGSLTEANHMLSRRYSVVGEVVRGDGRGRKIGFPTANLKVSEAQVLPHRGVYSGTIKLECGRVLACVINIGIRPTFEGDGVPTTEVHILDFDEDLYEKRLEVWFHDFIRAEEKFSGVDALVAQIHKDCMLARQNLKAQGVAVELVRSSGCG